MAGDQRLGRKTGGLPFRQYIFAHYLRNGTMLTDGDVELQRLAAVEFAKKPEFTQLTAFLLLAYAERLNPGAIYKAEGKN